jgi:hypothetical protein
MKKTFVILAGIIFMAMGVQAQQALARSQPQTQAQPQQAPPQQPVQQAPPQAQPQPPKSSQFMMITFFEDYGIGGRTRMIETQEDGSQQVRVIDWKSPYTFARTADHDDSLMMALKPFLDEGWSPVSSNATPGSNGYSVTITRYILIKEQ